VIYLSWQLLKMRIQILTFLILISSVSFGQEKCECCTYASIDNRENFDKFFIPKTIASSNTKHAEVYSIQIDQNDSIKYLQARFKFNSEGYVVERKWYNRGGKPHSIYLYERNNNDLITKITFYYLDSLENILDSFFPDITDLEYDSNGHLIKLKERDHKGKILPDEKSHYSIFKYDQLGRLKTKYRQSYYEGNDSYIYETEYSYTPKSQLKTSLTKYKGNSWTKSEVSLDKKGKPVQIIDTSLPENQLAWKKTFKYDQFDKLIILNIESGPASIDECPEQGRYRETYSYDSSGLLIQIDHRYGEIVCRMLVTYN
jgi:hypothetical protein